MALAAVTRSLDGWPTLPWEERRMATSIALELSH
jgi:hypothetical protein